MAVAEEISLVENEKEPWMCHEAEKYGGLNGS